MTDTPARTPPAIFSPNTKAIAVPCRKRKIKSRPQPNRRMIFLCSFFASGHSGSKLYPATSVPARPKKISIPAAYSTANTMLTASTIYSLTSSPIRSVYPFRTDKSIYTAFLPHQISCGNSAGPPIYTPRKILTDFPRGPRILPRSKSCGFYTGTPKIYPTKFPAEIVVGTPVPSPEGNIRMKNKEKPLPQKGAYLVVRDRIFTPRKILTDFPRGPLRGMGFDAVTRRSAPPKILSAGTPKIYPTKFPAEIRRGPRIKNTRKKVAGRRPFCMFKMFSRPNNKICCPPFL